MAKENTKEKHNAYSLNTEKSRNPVFIAIICITILVLTFLYLLPTGTIIGHKQKNAATAFILNIFQPKIKESGAIMKDKYGIGEHDRKEAYSGEKK